MIAYFKNSSELKMNFQKNMRWKFILFMGVLFAFGVLPVSAARAEMEDVKVIERKPDASNPMYEIIKVEGGLIFRAPKDMTFVKQDGIIAPISTEEYCLRKFGGVEKQIEALSKRIDALEENARGPSEKKDQESL
jgi:hypothetical protein